MGRYKVRDKGIKIVRKRPRKLNVINLNIRLDGNEFRKEVADRIVTPYAQLAKERKAMMEKKLNILLDCPILGFTGIYIYD